MEIKILKFEKRLNFSQNIKCAQKICTKHRFIVFFYLRTFAFKTKSIFLESIRELAKGIYMNLIIATIKPFKLEDVREALTGLGVKGMMVTEIKGFGSQSGHTEIYRGAEYAVNFVPKIKLEIVVEQSMIDQVVETIKSSAHTGKIGDGKIFVLDVQQTVRVRTGETGADAI